LNFTPPQIPGVNDVGYDGEIALILNHDNEKAYIIREGFWGWYKRNFGFKWLGEPLEDEHLENNVPIQKFQRGYLTWDRSIGKVIPTYEIRDKPIIQPQQIWPGDTNNDGRVNIADVLPIGVFWHETGTERPVPCQWGRHIISAWESKNATYADADGSGRVDVQEVPCIGINWGQIHDVANAKLATLKEGNGSLDYDVHENPTMYDITVYARNVENLFGISFIANYAPIYDISGIEARGGDLFGEDALFFVHTDYDTGEISVAISRKNGQFPVNGNGIIAHIKVPRSSSQTTQFKIVSIQGNDSQGNSFTLASGPATAIQNESRFILQEFSLSQNYPNPFNSNAVIRYELPELAMVQLIIYDILGQPVRTLVEKQQSTGGYEVNWDGRDDRGKEVGSSLYFYRLNTETYHQTRRMVLLR